MRPVTVAGVSSAIRFRKCQFRILSILQSCPLSCPQSDTYGNFLDRIVANLDPESGVRFAPQRELELGAEHGEGQRFEFTGNRPAAILPHAYEYGIARCLRFGALRG